MKKLIDYLRNGPTYSEKDSPMRRMEKEGNYDLIMDFGGEFILNAYCKIQDWKQSIKKYFKNE